MKVIAVLGRKGGTGKTMVSHLISHGMSMLDYVSASIMLQTDVRTHRPAEIVEGRNYMLASVRNDGTEKEMMMKIFEFAGKIDNSVLVVDGGANRRSVDLFYTKLADIILIPTGYGHEDLATADADYYELSDKLKEENSEAGVFIIPNRWPGLQRKREQIESKHWVREYMTKFSREGSLFPYYVPDIPSMLEIAHGETPRSTPLIDSRSRSIATLIAKKIGMDVTQAHAAAA